MHIFGILPTCGTASGESSSPEDSLALGVIGESSFSFFTLKDPRLKVAFFDAFFFAAAFLTFFADGGFTWSGQGDGTVVKRFQALSRTIGYNGYEY